MIVNGAKAPLHTKGGGATTLHLSNVAGLTQYGAYQEMRPPGATSSMRHWHEAEDEVLYVLEGEVTVAEDDGEHVVRPGQATGWAKAVANAPCLRNRSDRRDFYVVVGTRPAEVTAHYPGIDLHYTRRNGLRTMSRKDGTPCPGWPKETNR